MAPAARAKADWLAAAASENSENVWEVAVEMERWWRGLPVPGFEIEE